MAGSDAGLCPAAVAVVLQGSQPFPPASCFLCLPAPTYPVGLALSVFHPAWWLGCLASPRNVQPSSFHSPKRNGSYCHLLACGVGAGGRCRCRRRRYPAPPYSPLSLLALSLIFPGSFLLPIWKLGLGHLLTMPS